MKAKKRIMPWSENRDRSLSGDKRRRKLFVRGLRYVLSFELVFLLFLNVSEYKGLPFFAEINSTLDLTVVMTVITLLLGISSFAKERPKLGRWRRRFVFVGLIFIILTTINFLWYNGVPDLTNGLAGLSVGGEKYLRLISVSGVIFVSATFVIRTRERVQRFIELYVVFALYLSICGLFGLFGLAAAEEGRVASALGGNYQSFGRSSGAGVVVCITFLLLRKGLVTKIIISFALAILAVGLASSGHRTPFVAIPLTFGVMAAMIWLLSSDRAVLRALTTILMSVVILSALTYTIVNYVERAEVVKRRFEGFMETGDTGRTEIYRACLLVLPNNPILGVGFGSGTEVAGQTQFRHPHNILLELQLELGLVGLMLFGYILFGWMKGVKRVRWGDDYILFAAMALFWFHFFNANVSADLPGNRDLLCIAVMLHTLFAGSESLRSGIRGSNKRQPGRSGRRRQMV